MELPTIEFNEDAESVCDYLKADKEKLEEFKKKFDGTPVLASLKAIITSDSLSLNEKYTLLFDVGSHVGQQRLYQEMQRQQMRQVTQGQPVL